MAPTPTDDGPVVQPSASAKPDPTYWTKANIAFTAVFATLFVAIILALLAFFLHRRSQKKKYAKPNTDKAALLDQEGRGSSMFSRQRESSVTLYVDNTNGQNRGVNQETTHLIPLQSTSAEESRDAPNHNNTTESAGSGVSAASRATSGTSFRSAMLSPVSPYNEGSDLGVRITRPRSTSSASQRMRYYDTTPSVVDMPPIPKIVHTPSQ